MLEDLKGQAHMRRGRLDVTTPAFLVLGCIMAVQTVGYGDRCRHFYLLSPYKWERYFWYARICNRSFALNLTHRFVKVMWAISYFALTRVISEMTVYFVKLQHTSFCQS